ncbi:MAG: serine/threonine-protein kinase [Pseudomonadota bacterium]
MSSKQDAGASEHERCFPVPWTTRHLQFCAPEQAGYDTGNLDRVAMEPRTSRYQSLGLLADGGMAEICLARDLDRDTLVALKRIKRPFDADPDYVEMFQDECRVWARLRHPNVVRLLEHGSDEEGPFLAMELVDGTDLATLLQDRRSQPLPLAFALTVACALFDAMAYLHAMEDEEGCTLCLIHRDVSPGNLLCGTDGAVKLTDFGVVQVVVKTHKTRVGDLKGKFAYMSPEQTRGEALTPASDLFSAGIVLWEMLAGRPLFDRDTDLDTVQAVRDAEIPAPGSLRDGVMPGLDALVLQLLQRDAGERPSGAEQVAAQVRRLAREEGLSLGPVPVQELMSEVLGQRQPLEDRVRPAPRRRTLVVGRPDTGNSRRWWVPALVVGLVVLATGIALRDWQRPGEGQVLDAAVLQTPRDAAPALVMQVVGREAGILAPTTEDAAVQRTAQDGHEMSRRDAGVVRPTHRRPIRVAQPSMAADAASGYGWLDLHAEPWAQVAIDGVSIKRHTPLRDLSLPVGTHRITLHNPVFDLTRTIQVEVRAGERVQRSVDLTAR